MPIDGDIIPEASDKGLDLDISKLFKTAVNNEIDTYTTIEEAQDRAIEMGGSGHHEHSLNGSTVFMPFASHAEYIAAEKNKKIDLDSIQKK